MRETKTLIFRGAKTRIFSGAEIGVIGAKFDAWLNEIHQYKFIKELPSLSVVFVFYTH